MKNEVFMKKKLMVTLFVCFFLAISGLALAKKKQVVKVVGGTPITRYGLIIDASYDPKLDTFVPGYKILNVAIFNDSLNIIVMSPQKDEWWIKIKNQDKKYKVIGDLRSEDSAVWNKMPEHARSLVSYPLLLPIGARQIIDLFVPDNVRIEEFSELIVYIDSLGTTFEVLARQ